MDNIDKLYEALGLSLKTDITKFRGKIQRPALMPKNWDELVGQKNIKILIRNAIVTAQKLNQPFPHTLLTGMPGCGKTTIAFLIADSLKTKIVPLQGAMIDKPIDVYTIFQELSKNGKFPILFIDEIHSINKKMAELLYLAIDSPGTQMSFAVWGNIQETIKIPQFSLIGCTAGEEGKLKKPFLDRFGLKLHLEKYGITDIEKIVSNSAERLNLTLSDKIVSEIAKRSCLTPRIANNILLRFHEYVIANDVEPSMDHLHKLFTLMDIDEYGLNKFQRAILDMIIETKGFCGLRTLATSLGIDESSILAYESALINLGFLVYTKRGRAITKKGLEYMGIQINGLF